MDNAPPLLDITAVRRLCGNISRATVYRQMQREDNPFPCPIELGGRTLWKASEVAEYIEALPRKNLAWAEK